MRLLLNFILVVFLSACYYDNEEELYPSNMNDCNTEQLTFTADIQPIINSSCAIPACHQAGGNGFGNFETYSGLKAILDNGSFENRVIIQRNMPPNRELSSCEIEKLKEWLNQGAPNN